MESYVGLDVSLRQTSICVVDQTGKILFEGVVNSTPEAIVEFVKSKAAGAVRIGLETGPTSTWLWTEIKALGLPVICIDARHARAALKMQINKSDRNDAFGIARIMQCGWYKEVRVKKVHSHAMRALLESRALLVKMKRDLENQYPWTAEEPRPADRHGERPRIPCSCPGACRGKPYLAVAVLPLLETRNGIVRQIADLDRKVLMLARNDNQARSFMTVPGIGPVTALCYRATIDEPSRFRRSRSVGAYVGLTTRRYASGEVDWTGRISKCGDAMLRSYLFEAAGVLLTRVHKWCALKAWARAWQSASVYARRKSPSRASSP